MDIKRETAHKAPRHRAYDVFLLAYISLNSAVCFDLVKVCLPPPQFIE